jgi:hypothetical protein
MARFANTPALARRAPTSLGPHPIPAYTHEFGQGYTADDAHVELFSAAVNGFLADGFYDKADDQIERLIATVAKCDPDWLLSFIPWLRNDAYLRSAPLVLAAEYARSGFPDARKVVSSAMHRADEPGEMLGYWFSRYGRNLPAAVKRGIADAVTRLYTQRALLRYDGNAKGFRFGDVIELVHPKADSPAQNALFKFALDRRRHAPVADPEVLGQINATMALEVMPQALRSTDVLAQALLDPKVVFSWERASGWLGRPLTSADWAALLPSMGYMAVMRNLNNFDKAGLHAAPVIAKLSDADAIRSNKVMPFRFLTAYKNLEADTYKVALADAANMALHNLPEFPGKTLIMVDCSGSMFQAVGGGRSRNPLQLMDLAAFFAEAIARRCQYPLIVAYGSTAVVRPYSLGLPEPRRHQHLAVDQQALQQPGPGHHPHRRAVDGS